MSSLPGVEHGNLYYRFLEANKNDALKNSKGNFEQLTSLTSNAKTEVLWWSNISSNAVRLINSKKNPDLVISMDASLTGWGAAYDNLTCGGHWSEKEREYHINVLELKAIFFGLKSFLTEIRDKHIRIRSDNITAITYINNKGGVKSLKCHRIAREIWEWAIDHNNHITAEHIPGVENTLADKASRKINANIEWSLFPKIFSLLEKKFGPFNIDLFASRLNFKNSCYCSWKPDPNAAHIDAFLTNWNKFKFYAFPPFSLILRVLAKIKADRATGLLICPLWPTQPWFPKLMQMIIDVPLILPLNALYLPFKRSQAHKLGKNLRLIACVLSGDTCLVEAFQKNLSTSCVPLGEEVRLNNTESILKNGYISAIRDKLIPCRLMKCQ